MRLHPGDRLGQYQVLELLGEGGMGTVYRAHDSRLERDVAIKIIRAALAADPERIGRFVREARLLASLNHPHVATIHDLEEIHDTRFLVMELVEGVTLSDRLRAGPFAVREALTLALQIVEAIEAAHDRNIIHRDLKPANIKLTPSGSIKVLDFGLAKALAINPAASALAQSPTFTANDTGVGVILGTAAYMSPEQARGREVDKRTDVWAFGCVLFDMLAGKAAFAGDTVSDTLAAILTRDPDWSLLPPDLPRSVTRLLRRCFEKDVNRRLRDIGDARFDLEEAIALTSDSGRLLADQALAPAPQATPIRRPSLLVLAGLVAGALVGAVSIAALNRQAQGAPQRQTVRFALTLPEDQRVAALDFEALAISPNDDFIAYVGTQNGRQQLYVRALSALEPKPLRGTDGALEPFFSPDGKWIGFFADGKLKKVPVSEGPVREIAEAEIGFGGAWAPDGTIIFAPSNASGLMRVSAEGGPVQPVTTLDTVRGEFSHRWPALLPDGKTVLFAIGTVGTWDDAAIASKRIDKSDRPRVLMQGGTYPRYLSTGQLLYAHGGAIHAVPLAAGGDVSGTSVKFQPDVLQSADGAAQFAISPRGSLIYVPGGGAANDRTLVWVDRNGNVEPLAAPPQPYTSLRLSPDGRTLAATLAGTPEQIWTYAIADNRLTQFTYDGGSAPAWSGDGARIFFSAAREGPAALFVRRTNTNVEQRLSRSEHVDAPQSVSPDGSLLFVRIDPDSGRDLWVLSPDGTARPLIATPANESSAVFSPDGQWLAFVSDETGRPEVFIARRTDPQRRLQVSTAGGTEPVWRKDGSELFFRSGNRMMSAGVRGRPMVSLSPPRLLFEAPFEKGPSYAAAYDVSTDGMRFLMIRPADTDRLGREMRITLARSDDSGR